VSTPFYVSPQQAMADRAEYARKGIARGRSLVVLQYTDGIVFVGENPSRALHKFSEIYDRIGFAAAGKYNEYENLRIGGVRYADLRGYTYDRDDVTARGLANVYAQTLGTIFSSAGEKPYEVELVVAEVGEEPSGDQIYRLPHDGSIVDEHGSVAVGGNAEQIGSFLDQRHRDGMSLAEALKLAVQALSRDTNGSEREIPAERLEVAVLDRTRPQQRKFKRIVGLIVSVLGAYLAWTLMAAEVLFVAAKDEDMPRFLGRSSGGDVPVPALLMTTSLSQVVLVVTAFSDDAFNFALDLTSALSLIPFLLAAAFAVKIALRPEREKVAGDSTRGELVVGVLATVYTAFLLYAAGLKFVLVSFILYAPATFLFVKARREQGRRLFSGRELVILAVSVAGAVLGVVALAAGWISL
jgi:proteasome alpha subunit